MRFLRKLEKMLQVNWNEKVHSVTTFILVWNKRREMCFVLWYASSSPHYMDDILFLQGKLQ